MCPTYFRNDNDFYKILSSDVVIKISVEDGLHTSSTSHGETKLEVEGYDEITEDDYTSVVSGCLEHDLIGSRHPLPVPPGH